MQSIDCVASPSAFDAAERGFTFRLLPYLAFPRTHTSSPSNLPVGEHLVFSPNAYVYFTSNL